MFQYSLAFLYKNKNTLDSFAFAASSGFSARVTMYALLGNAGAFAVRGFLAGFDLDFWYMVLVSMHKEQKTRKHAPLETFSLFL